MAQGSLGTLPFLKQLLAKLVAALASLGVRGGRGRRALHLLLQPLPTLEQLVLRLRLKQICFYNIFLYFFIHMVGQVPPASLRALFWHPQPAPTGLPGCAACAQQWASSPSGCTTLLLRDVKAVGHIHSAFRCMRGRTFAREPPRAGTPISRNFTEFHAISRQVPKVPEI